MEHNTKSFKTRGQWQNLVIGSKTSRDLSPFLTSCKPFFAHARSQPMDYGIRDRFFRAKMSNEKKSIMVCTPPEVQKKSDLEKEARFLANPFSSFPIFYLSKPNEPKLGNASIVGRALDGTGTVAPISSMETKPCPFEEMSPISGYLPSNAR